MIEVDDYVPIPRKGRKAGSKNKISSEREMLLEEARALHAKGVDKIAAAISLDVKAVLQIEPETFAKLI